MRIYLRCGKCGRFQGPTKEAGPDAKLLEGEQIERTTDAAGQVHYVVMPERWTVIRLNEVEVSLCGDCAPSIWELLRGYDR